jgi:hypothetical protein
MYHCCFPGVVGACCARLGPRLRWWRMEQQTAAIHGRGSCFSFFFLPPLWATASEPPIWVTPACGVECQARPSAALAHLSARAKSVVTLSTLCVANFSSIFSSRTPWRKAVVSTLNQGYLLVLHKGVVRGEWRPMGRSKSTAWQGKGVHLGVHR